MSDTASKSPKMDAKSEGENNQNNEDLHSDNNQSSRKRTISQISADSATTMHCTTTEIDCSLDMSADPPDGIHPALWAMLKTIRKNTETTNEKIEDLDHRVLILEDQADNSGASMARMQCQIDSLAETTKALMGRLVRAENKLERQRTEICDLRARSMRDNIIIKTHGNKYKEFREEDTASVFRKFVSEELRIPHSNNIDITRAHRMGKPSGDRNAMIIAKLNYASDQKKIFDNAKVLKITNYSISKQIPPEMEERRQFGWPELKKARDERKRARFDGGKLIVENEHLLQFDPEPLPPLSKLSLNAATVAPLVFPSDPKSEAGHHFQAWAATVQSLQQVRECYDELVKVTDVAMTDHLAYAYRFTNDTYTHENFDSDGDNGTGLQIIKILRTIKCKDIAIFVSHSMGISNIPMAIKIDVLKHVVNGAVLALKNGMTSLATEKEDAWMFKLC